MYRTKKLSDGSTFRQSYSVGEYFFVKVFEWFLGLTILLFFTIPTYTFLKIPFWIIRKILYYIPKTKSLSIRLSNRNNWINDISTYKAISSILLTPLLWGAWLATLNGMFGSKPSKTSQTDTLSIDTINLSHHKNHNKKIKLHKVK